MFRKLREEDFLALRKPLESKRQSPKSLGSLFILIIFLQCLLLFIEHFVSEYSIYPNIDNIIKIHLIFSILLMILTLVYAVPWVYMRSQKVQYFLSILVSQNLFGVSAMLLAIIAISAEISTNTISLQRFTTIALFIGVIVFIITCIRFYFLLNRGRYRKGSKKDVQRNKLETKSLLPIVIPIGIGITFLIQYLVRNYNLLGIDTIMVSTLLIIIFYVMLFVLPEQLVILYCKFRFESFNYELNGRLKQVKDEHGKGIPEEKLESYFKQKTN
ncbi:hypothetical protein [Oceanobacillus manasiensis]|uniref:hypothetical protein n=1 Tax=Oceanobacillus manasiensis TaxID=586413 RepID=UPI0005A9B552|nr:hypothetical protein [Oceanobacillus manasiensis]